jgi:aspartate-semialdehyde dehydrogenase
MSDNKKFGYRVAIFDPSSLKGKEMKKVLFERSFPLESMKMIDSKKNIGTLTEFDEEAMIVTHADRSALEEADVIFFCGNPEETKELIVQYDDFGFYAFDLTRSMEESETYRYLTADLEHDDIRSFDGIYATPHSASTPLVKLLRKLDKSFSVRLAAATVMTPVSETGDDGITNLHSQASDLLAFKSVEGKQQIFNLYPRPERHKEEADEIKAQVERLTKIDKGKFTLSIIDVPIFFCNLFSLYIEFDKPPGEDMNWKKFFSSKEGFSFDGIVADGAEPVGPVEIADTDFIHIQITDSESDDYSRVWFWMLADNIRIGSVLNAVKLAEIVLEL